MVEYDNLSYDQRQKILRDKYGKDARNCVKRRIISLGELHEYSSFNNGYDEIIFATIQVCDFHSFKTLSSGRPVFWKQESIFAHNEKIYVNLYLYTFLNSGLAVYYHENVEVEPWRDNRHE